MSQKIFSKEVDIEVPFHDADMMYVAWHGHYLKYFEIARCALLDTFSYNYMDMMASGYAWPIIEAHLRYPGSALFGQTIRVKATLTEWENRLPEIAKGLLLVLLTLCASLSVRADELQSILQMLAARPLVRAEFSQEKTLPALKKPLHSEGQLVFAGKEGVLMFIRKPVAAQLAITPNVLLQKTARTQTRLRLDQSPYGAAAGIFSQLMSGDAKKLQSSFHVEALEKNGITWTLHLRPRDNRLQKLFRKLRISGDAYLRELHISDTSGGETLMRLTEHSSLPASLTDNERELLKLAH